MTLSRRSLGHSFRTSVLPLLAGLWLNSGTAIAEPVRIPGPEGDLEGELLHAASSTDIVILIPGSGLTDRDGNNAHVGLASDSYRLLAEGLYQRGISSLRVDKRGLYGSRAAISDPNDLSISAYAQDMRQWVTMAANQTPCVWLAGHSEGGLVALFAAAHEPPDSLCGLILLAAPGRPLGQVMIEQLAMNPHNASLMAEMRAIVSEFEQGNPRPASEIPHGLHAWFPATIRNFLIDLLSHDPAHYARAWPGPALVVQGNRDIQVNITDANILAANLPHPNLLALETATHMLKEDIPGAPFATYHAPNLPLHPDLIAGLVSFIQASD